MTSLNTIKAETFRLSEAEKCELDAACDEALNACDAALNKADKVIQGKNAIIKIQKEQNQVLKSQIVDLEEERDSIFKNPIVWFFIGVAVGGLSYGLVTSK